MTAFYNEILSSIQYFFSFFLEFNILYFLVIIILLPLWAFVFPKFLPNRKNQPFKPIVTYKPQISRELIYTLSTMLIFPAMFLVYQYFLQDVGFFRRYTEISGLFGWAYAIFTLALLFVWHDTVFFWTHKIMHHPKLFQHIHKVHHLSRDIEPLSSISFHPYEALVQISWAIPLFIVIPISTPVFLTYLVLEAAHTFYGHSGYELFPSGFTKHWLGKYIATSTHHNMHHSKPGGHYGLYFTWWDKLTNTEFADYHDTFEKVTNLSYKKIST
jgi:Delta7-sterol 5-desaturase